MYADAEPCPEAGPRGQTARAQPAGQVKENVKSRSMWLRLLYMVLFGVVFWILWGVLAVVVGIQFLIALVTGSPNERLVRFGHELGIYYHDIVVFLTFKTDAKPFPFSDWRTEADSAAATRPTEE